MKEAISDGFRQASPDDARQPCRLQCGMAGPREADTVQVDAEYKEALQVANYIFGNNQGGKDGEKIAMTSPVGIEEDFRSMKGGGGEKIAMTSPVTTSMDGKK